MDARSGLLTNVGATVVVSGPSVLARAAAVLLLAVGLGAAAGCGGDGQATHDAAASEREDAAAGAPDIGRPSFPDAVSGGCGRECPAGTWCESARGRCVECLEDAHCEGAGLVCERNACTPIICAPGEASCVDDGSLQRCNGRGTGWLDLRCEEGELCRDGECRTLVCAPGSSRCDGNIRVTCPAPGFYEESHACPAGELCVPDRGCMPLNHNLVIVFDTSGSMNRVPGSGEPGYDWPEAWPQCESLDQPETRIGIARKLFRRLLDEQQTLLESGHFVLMRFPQHATGDHVDSLAAPGPEACDYGLWQFDGDLLTGDDDWAHLTGEGPDDWFAESVWQTVLVPDPRRPGFASTPPGERREQIRRWLDGEESAAPGALACTPEDAIDVCGLERPCLGAEGQRTCHDITNPELRGFGRTPLGRTLFYASEYLRRYVYVDGRPCTTDAQCASANYECGEDGTCHDPLRSCREALVLLFTDGAENPPPQDAFSRAVVQAKRLHYGLGCEQDADCLSGASCRDGVCVTDALLAAAAEDVGFAEDIGYVDPEGHQRLEDDLGHPIRVTVQVMDVGGGYVDNERLALAGGGELIHQSLEELDQLLLDLAAVFDVKVGAECLGP